MDDAGHRVVAECDKLSNSSSKVKDKKLQYKMAGVHIQGNLRPALTQIEGLRANLGQGHDAFTARSADCNRLYRTISDRDVGLD